MHEDEKANETVIAKPFAVESVPWQEFSQGTRFASRFRALSDFGGASHFGVAIEELPPGKQSCPVHYHMLEEEQLMILEGEVTLRLGDDTHILKTGDFIVFPAGQKAGHALINNSNAVCRYLIMGEKNLNEVCVYPETGKVGVRSLGEIYDKTATKTYWDDE